MLPVLSAKMIKTIKKAVAATPSKLMSPGQIDMIEKLVGVRKAKKIVKQLKEEGASVQTASDVIAKIQDNMGKGARQGKPTSKAADKHTKPARAASASDDSGITIEGSDTDSDDAESDSGSPDPSSEEEEDEPEPEPKRKKNAKSSAK